MDIQDKRRGYVALFALAVLLGAPYASTQSPQSPGQRFVLDGSKSVAPPETGYLAMGSPDAGRSPGGSTLSVNSRSLILDGKPWLPVMGEFHFSRYPEKYWEEEIAKLKAAGVQVVSTYVFWIHHEEIRGQFDWSGQRDLRTFVGLCAKHGLYVFPRIGPWAHGEVRNGGFPDWLIALGPTRVKDSTFLAPVKSLYREIGKQLKGMLWKDGGSVIGIQIENEYADRSPNGGETYLLTLKQMAMDAGLDVPLYTVTGWDNAVVPPHAFVPVYGGYPDEPWSGSRGELAPDPQGVYQFHVGSPVGTAGILQGRVAPGGDVQHEHVPRFSAELGGGMELTYHRRVVISPDDIGSMALSALGSGVNLIGYYMFHGGANPQGRLTTQQESQATDYPNDVPVISYDFQAPLGEFGQMNASLRTLKPLHQFLCDFGPDLATMQGVVPDVVPAGPRDTLTLRVAARTDGTHGYLFFNNYLRKHPLPVQKGVQVSIKLSTGTVMVPANPVDIPSQSFFYWPLNLDLRGARLTYATAQPFAVVADAHEAHYFFSPSSSINAEFAFAASTVDSLSAASGVVTREDGRITIHGVGPSRNEAITFLTRTGQRVHVVLLSHEDAMNAWKLRINGRERLLVTPADVFVVDDTLHMRSRDPNAFALSVFPRFDSEPASNTTISASVNDGVFFRYTPTVKKIVAKAHLRLVRKSAEVPPVRMGKVYDWRNGAVATSPDEATFDKAGVWRIALPHGIPAGASDLFLGIHYAGDIGRLYAGKQMLDDNFFNGTTWEVGLKRFSRELSGKDLNLQILPLRKDAPVYLPGDRWPDFAGGTQVADVKSVALTTEYEVTLTVGARPLSRQGKFVLGADITALDAPGHGRYAQKRMYQEDGKPSDELTILTRHGWNAYRVRVFLSPVRNAPDNSLENAIPLAQRIKATGSVFLLSIHYSDTWADPQHQEIPVAWQGQGIDSLEKRVESYSKDVIARFKAAGAMPDWVQIGNEITRGTLWPIGQIQFPGSNEYHPPPPYDETKQWENLTRILKAGIRGVLSGAGDSPPRICMHIDKSAHWPITRWFFDHLDSAHVPYDMITQSFYPPWHHGTLEGLWTNMVECAQRYHKDFLVTETGYDSSRVADNGDMLWPVTPAGRLQFIADLVNTVRKAPLGLGVMYWAPERDVWNPDGSPGPTVFVLDSLSTLTHSGLSHVPLIIEYRKSDF